MFDIITYAYLNSKRQHNNANANKVWGFRVLNCAKCQLLVGYFILTLLVVSRTNSAAGSCPTCWCMRAKANWQHMPNRYVWYVVETMRTPWNIALAPHIFCSDGNATRWARRPAYRRVLR